MQKVVRYASYYALAAWMAIGAALFVDWVDQYDRPPAEYLQIGYAWPLYAGVATMELMNENIEANYGPFPDPPRSSNGVEI